MSYPEITEEVRTSIYCILSFNTVSVVLLLNLLYLFFYR